MGLENLKRPTADIPSRYQVNRNKSPLTTKNSVFDPGEITRYGTTVDNSKIVKIGTRIQGDIDISTGTSYFPNNSSDIDASFNPIVGSDQGQEYENRIYGVNTYKGSNKDDEIGGIFNSPIQKYSTTFRTINTPTINEIVDQGNTVTRAGFPVAKQIVETVQNLENVTPTKYFDGGQINIPGTSFNKRGITVEGVPITNAITTGNLQFRTVTPGQSDIFPDVLGEGDLRESQLATKFKNLLDPRRTNGGFRSGLLGGEPYQIFDTDGTTDAGVFGGAEKQSNQRGIPFSSAQIDANRIAKFIASPAGATFLLKQSLLTAQSAVVTKGFPNNKIKRLSAPLSGIASDAALPLTILAQGTTGGVAKSERGFDVLVPDPLHVNNGLKYEQNVLTTAELGAIAITTNDPRGPAQPVDKSFLPRSTNLADFFGGLTGPTDNFDAAGDVHTNAGVTGNMVEIIPDPLGLGLNNITDTKQYEFVKDNFEGGRTPVADSKKKIEDSYGLPFYFKDMRDNSVIIFRAYVNGINENVKPNWNSSQFIGRSEPIYNYSHGERDINFNLRLNAGTRQELDVIYAKMNRLTSMAYPEYRGDVSLAGKSRMKPPLTKMRYGDLYDAAGQPNEKFTGLLGFISSITYTIPDEATYETAPGSQIPKHIDVAISYTVIHNEIPEKSTKFYGVMKKFVEETGNIGVNYTDPVPGTDTGGGSLPGEPAGGNYG